MSAPVPKYVVRALEKAGRALYETETFAEDGEHAHEAWRKRRESAKKAITDALTRAKAAHP